MPTEGKTPAERLVPYSRLKEASDKAEALRARVAERLLAHLGGRVIGYKIACTNAIAQEFLSMPEPFYGRLFSAKVQSKGKVVVQR